MRVVLPLLLPEVAVMVVVPELRPLTIPFAAIVATLGLLLLQITSPRGV